MSKDSNYMYWNNTLFISIEIILRLIVIQITMNKIIDVNKFVNLKVFYHFRDLIEWKRNWADIVLKVYKLKWKCEIWLHLLFYMLQDIWHLIS